MTSAQIAPMIAYLDPDRADPWDEKPIPVMTLAELQASAASIRWIVKHVLPAESVALMFGASGTFKSFVALDLALHVAHGLPWMGRKTTKGPVLYVAAEGGAGLWKRIDAWHRHRGINVADAQLYVVPVAVDMLEDADRLADHALKTITEPPVLAVVDTLSQTFSGEENSAQEVSQYLSAIARAFRERLKSSILVIHHTGHTATERPRGSSALRANVDVMFGVHRDEKEMLATLSCHKQKDGDSFQDTMFHLTIHDLYEDEDGDKVTSLVATAIMDEAHKAQLVQREVSKGRSGTNAKILELAQNGCFESDLRKAFYDTVDGDTDKKRQYYFRARKWAEKAGLMDFSGERVFILGGGIDEA